MSWPLCCPACRQPLGVNATAVQPGPGPGRGGAGPAGVGCRRCGRCYRRADGGGAIWQLLRAEDRPAVERFLADYTHVRRAEGRGSDDPAYYRRLPAVDAADPLAWQWSIRRRSWEHVHLRLFASAPPARRVLDIGAGVGWVSHHLAAGGHDVLAVDLSLDERDGLRACRHYEAAFGCVQAHFDHLPLDDGSADVVLFNASLHYSTDYAVTLTEALRVLRPDGVVAVIDSPIYRHACSGAETVAERHADFERRFGVASNSVPSRQFLTGAVLDELTVELGLRWERSAPFYGWRWAARPWLARLRRRREPSRFALLVGRR